MSYLCWWAADIRKLERSNITTRSRAYLHDLTHHRLVVVLQGHSDHVEADDESDEDVQIVAGADRMNKEANGAVGSIVRQTLRLFSGKREMGS